MAKPDIQRCREISARLKELGVPPKATKKLDRWIDKKEKEAKGKGA